MPRFRVEVSTQLENIESIQAPEDYPFFIHLLCGNCGEKTNKPVVLTKNDEVEGIRKGAVNLKRTCKLCKRISDVKIISDQMTYSEADCPGWAPFLILECRGNEPSEVMLSDDVPLLVSGTDGFQFDDVIIEDNEFYGWDEKRNVEASITEFQIRIVKE